VEDWKSKFKSVFKTTKPVIGMVHLKPLPGSPSYDSSGGMKKIMEAAYRDTERLVSGGIDAVQVENQWDRPFLKSQNIGPETVAAVSAAACNLRARFDIPMGITIHLNGAAQALAVAVAVGCSWVRVFELANAYIANAGIIEAAGPAVMRYRSFLRAENIMVFGDFHVKHGSHQITSDRDIVEQAEDVQTALGDAVIVTGIKTGVAPQKDDIMSIRDAVSLPILIGSGLSVKNLDEIFPLTDGAIVGSSFKENGVLSNAVDLEKVKLFMQKAKKVSDR
jgi:membrane complex biogenesis BtpA family protein